MPKMRNRIRAFRLKRARRRAEWKYLSGGHERHDR